MANVLFMLFLSKFNQHSSKKFSPHTCTFICVVLLLVEACLVGVVYVSVRKYMSFCSCGRYLVRNAIIFAVH